MQIRLPLLVAASVFAVIGTASAWTPPAVGQACTGLRGKGPEVVRIAGNYMGGRAQRDGMMDHRAFQRCFRDQASCESWVAGLAIRYPLRPGIATCTSVRLR